MLPPVPTGWVEAAKELPAARRSLDQLVERARADEELRKTVVANLEAALQRRASNPTGRSSRSSAASSQSSPAVPDLRSWRTMAAVSDDLLDVPVRELLARVTSDTPTPGGGSIAALVTALAAGLVEAVARDSAGWSDGRGVAAQAHALRERVAPLAQRDAEAYEEALARAPSSRCDRARDPKRHDRTTPCRMPRRCRSRSR